MLLFSKNKYIFISIFLLIFYIITIFLFYCKYYYSLINIIKQIEDAKIKIYSSKTNDNINRHKQNKLLIKKRKKIKSRKNIKNNNIPHNKHKNKLIKKTNLVSNQTKKITGKTKEILNNNIIKNTSLIKYETILKYNDNELNSLSYKKAIISDQRTYIQYYLSLLKEGNSLIFSFYNNNDYNSQIIKIFLFFFFFYLHFSVNALFFTDETMHTIYMEEGSFNFIYQLPKIIYSLIISASISIFIKFLAISQRKVILMKKEKKIEQLNKRVKVLIKTLKIKFALFLLFLYYFC